MSTSIKMSLLRSVAAILVICSLLFPAAAFAAVGFGAISAVDNAISRTSIAVTGSDTVGVVFVVGDDASDSITSATWGGVAMTKINSSSVETPGDRFLSAWCVSDPASEATIEFNDNTDNYWRNFNAYYTGAVCPVDSQAVNTSTGVNAISVTTTVVDAGSWLVMFQKDGTGGATYSASGDVTTMRANADAGGLAIADSDGAVGSGSKTGTLDAGGTSNHGAIIFSLAPAALAAFPEEYLIQFD